MNTESQTPTPEDKAWYVLLAYASLSKDLFAALMNFHSAYSKVKSVRKLLDNLKRTGTDFYNALRDVQDMHQASRAPEGEKHSIQLVSKLVTEAHNAVVTCPPKRINELATLIDNFKGHSYRALNEGVYEVIEAVPFEPEEQVSRLVSHYCPGIAPDEQERFATAITQLVAYQVKTEVLAQE